MNRRTVLTAGGAIGTSLLAGCGFAHAGGALRAEESVPQPASRELFAIADPGFVTARSGMGWVRDRDGEMDFGVHSQVTGITRGGDVAWRAAFEGGSDALAADDLLYLLRDERLIAAEPDDESTAGRTPELGTADLHWEVAVDGGGAPIAAGAGAVYLRRNESILRVAAGEITWEESFPAAPTTIHADEEGLIAIRAGAVVSLLASGDERWAFDTAGAAAIDARDGLVAIRDDDELWLADRVDGSEQWRESIAVGGDAPQIGPTAVAVPTGRGVARYDRGTGERTWRVTDGHRPSPAIALSEESLYAATADGTVLAVEAGEVQWR